MGGWALLQLGSASKNISPDGMEVGTEGGRYSILALQDLLNQLNADEHAACVIERFEAEHRLSPELDATVILLHDVRQILTGTNLYRILPTKVMVRGSPWCFNAFRKKAFAAALSRVLLKYDSTVRLRWSTAWYRYTRLPRTLI
jgi:hypothetical protein